MTKNWWYTTRGGELRKVETVINGKEKKKNLKTVFIENETREALYNIQVRTCSMVALYCLRAACGNLHHHPPFSTPNIHSPKLFLTVDSFPLRP